MRVVVGKERFEFRSEREMWAFVGSELRWRRLNGVAGYVEHVAYAAMMILLK